MRNRRWTVTLNKTVHKRSKPAQIKDHKGRALMDRSHLHSLLADVAGVGEGGIRLRAQLAQAGETIDRMYDSMLAKEDSDCGHSWQRLAKPSTECTTVCWRRRYPTAGTVGRGWRNHRQNVRQYAGEGGIRLRAQLAEAGETIDRMYDSMLAKEVSDCGHSW